MAGKLRYWLFERKFGEGAPPAEFIEPTPEGRKIFLWRFGAGVLAALVLIVGHNLVDRHMQTLPACARIPWLRAIFGVLVVVSLGVVLYNIVEALRMLRGGQWPLPGAAVLWRRAVQRGTRLCLRAWGILVASTFALGLLIWTAVLLHASPIFSVSAQAAACADTGAHAPHGAENNRG